MYSRLYQTLAVCLLLGLLTGCQTSTPIPAGTAKYSLRTLEGNLDATLEQTHKAALDAVEELEFELVTERRDSLNGQIEAQTALEEKITITISKLTNRSSNVTIRVGSLGDETKSRAIFETIREQVAD